MAWRSALVIVKPETVIGWHRKGFRLLWTWKVRRGQRGRPPVSKEIRILIRRMSRENPLYSKSGPEFNPIREKRFWNTPGRGVLSRAFYCPKHLLLLLFGRASRCYE